MKADLLIKSRAVFSGAADAPFPGYVAVKGNRIAAVGRGEEGARELIGAGTELIDAGERLVMPGFHDSHVHLLMAGLYRRHVNLIAARSEEEAARMTAEAAEKDPDKEGFVIGFGWYHVFWDVKRLPRKESLDRYFKDRPVLLVNAEAHGVWVNGKALALAGITRDTKDPFGGRIERDESGEATGFLYEGASGLVTRHALSFSPEREAEILRAFMEGAAAYGITSVNDVMPYFHGNMGSVPAYGALDARGGLSVRIHAAPNLLGDLDEVLAWQKKHSSDKLRVNTVKQFLDGVSTTHTALVLEDYADAPGDRGDALFNLEKIKKAVAEAHRRDLSVKLHSCGDASLRLALDYYENAIKLHGRNGTRHAIEHCEMVSERDMPRFGALGVIPSVQPEHLALTQRFAENPYLVTLGKERADKTWPLKSLLASAGVLAIGSDCPVVDSNPFLEIYRAVTRLHNDGEPAGGWNPTQKLTLAEILKCYTWGSAYGVRRENEIGTLAPGYFADIVILDGNPFTADVSALIEGKVDITVMDGKVIHARG
ncbi:MAG: amidohydrolase [Clostridiales Family XIII bacterium]|jgi:predicted amidohydrolase YtcJ|nr:amidohydrolase [Clostridiales Family XIII bacterium]